MQISLLQNKRNVVIHDAYFQSEINRFAAHIKTCQMEGDSMQPTIEPHEIIAIAECGNEITAEGIYAYTCLFWGKECLFIKRVVPLDNGGLRIIHDNPHYQSFEFSPEEASALTIHGKVVASIKVRRFS